eukprot:SAG11_NODE_28662_length_319_cov_0.800000_1_plen_47_part_10
MGAASCETGAGPVEPCVGIGCDRSCSNEEAKDRAAGDNITTKMTHTV